tara:strand:+ start:957 stop:1178 length:222 start_codon:yes stop_codon:yes gene_type:complete
MKNFLLVKLLHTSLFQSSASHFIGIRYEKFFKEYFFSFKPESRLLKNTHLICILKVTEFSNANVILTGKDSVI